MLSGPDQIAFRLEKMADEATERAHRTASETDMLRCAAHMLVEGRVMREALLEFHRLGLVIESAVRQDQPQIHDELLALMGLTRTALSKKESK